MTHRGVEGDTIPSGIDAIDSGWNCVYNVGDHG